MERTAQSDVDMVIAIGFTYQQLVEQIAPRYPATKFVLIDAKAAGRNVQSIQFGQHEGSFLAGMAAALFSRTQKLGFIGGMDVPVVRAFGCGYRQGARHVNPGVQFVSDTVSSGPAGFNDPDKAAALAHSQFERGADVIFAAAGRSGLGVLQIARNDARWAIGVDVNQNWVSPGAVLTSMVKRIDTAVYESLKEGHAGQWRPGARVMNLKEGGVDLAVDAHNRKLIRPDMSARIEQARRDIIEGKLVVADAASTGQCPVP
jgi:basic membrane protein A